MLTHEYKLVASAERSKLMPLQFPGDSTPTNTGISIRAIDTDTGRTVVVIASQEVIQDYGLDEVQRKASEKFDSRKQEPNGTVSIRTGDFA